VSVCVCLRLSVCIRLSVCLSVCVRSNKHSKKGDQELELAALQACAATLCCGVVYDPSGLNEKGYIYTWLYRLLTTRDELVTSSYLPHCSSGSSSIAAAAADIVVVCCCSLQQQQQQQ